MCHGQVSSVISKFETHVFLFVFSKTHDPIMLLLKLSSAIIRLLVTILRILLRMLRPFPSILGPFPSILRVFLRILSGVLFRSQIFIFLLRKHVYINGRNCFKAQLSKSVDLPPLFVLFLLLGNIRVQDLTILTNGELLVIIQANDYFNSNLLTGSSWSTYYAWWLL